MHVAHDGCNLPICTPVQLNQCNTIIRNSALWHAPMYAGQSIFVFVQIFFDR
jgi:hypothetical protein